MTAEKNKFELYTDLVDKFSLTQMKDELEEICDISNISRKYLQDKRKRPPITKV